MEERARRLRFGSIVEWALAAGLFIVIAAVASAVFREVRTVRPVVPVIAGEAGLYYDTPAIIPAGAVSIPVLLLESGAELRVGATASDVARHVKVLSESVEQGPERQRVTRFYMDGGVRFAIVFEAAEPDGELTAVAIYLP